MTDPALPPETRPEGAADLAALVASRLCHDLISPIGAIGNGIELLSLDLQPKSGEFVLLADSAAAANAKLRFFRLAFGHALREQKTSRAEIQPLLAEVYRSSRITLDWNSPTELPRPEAKLAFLMLLCGEHALPTGGTLAVLRDGVGWTLRATSPRLRHDETLWSLLGTPAPKTALAPAQVQFPLAGAQLHALGRRAVVDVGVSALTVSF